MINKVIKITGLIFIIVITASIESNIAFFQAQNTPQQDTTQGRTTDTNSGAASLLIKNALDKKSNIITHIANIATIINVLISLLNITFILIGLQITLRHFKLNRTWSYMERINSKEMLDVRIAVAQFIKKINNLDENSKKEYIRHLINSQEENDIKLDYQIRLILNILTELGNAFFVKSVNKKSLFIYDGFVQRYWESLKTYVYVTREIHQTSVFGSFEYLKDELDRLNIEKKWRRKTKEKYRIDKLANATSNKPQTQAKRAAEITRSVRHSAVRQSSRRQHHRLI